MCTEPSTTDLQICDACRKETGSIMQQNGPPCQTIIQKNTEWIHEIHQRNPKKPVQQASLTLGLPHLTVHDILHRSLKLHAYKL